MKKLVNRARESILFKTVFTIIVLLAIYAAIVSVIGYNEVTDALLAQHGNGAFRTARIAAHFIDPDKIPMYLESEGKGEEYENTYNRMSAICNSTGATFIYVILPDRTDYKHITFLFSTMNQDSNYTQYEFGYVRETTNEEYALKYKALCDGNSDSELVVRDKGYIETDPHITAMIPLVDSAGDTQAILCVQRQMDDLINVRNSYVGKVMISLFITAVLLIMALSLHLNHFILKPIRIISAEAVRFAKENVKTGQKLTSSIRNKDDIGHLAESIDEMETQIHSYVGNLTQVTAERERIKTELELAARIQSDMLPNIFPAFPGRKDFDIYATMDPAREIGGDFYNYFLIDESHLCVYIADVSGKGVPAALFMMASTIILESNAMMGSSPAEVLKSANEGICSTNNEEMFVTTWLGILDLNTGVLTAANAGHEYPMVKHPGGEYEMIKDEHGFVVGGLEDITYNNYEIQMEPGMELFLYTDGVPEAANSEEELFGTSRLLDALNKEQGAEPKKLLNNVKDSVNAFVGEAEQFDDMTMLCLVYKGRAD